MTRVRGFASLVCPGSLKAGPVDKAGRSIQFVLAEPLTNLSRWHQARSVSADPRGMFQSEAVESEQPRPVDAVLILGYAFRVAGQHAAVVFGASLLIQTGVLVVSFMVMNTFGLLGLAIWPGLIYIGSQLTVGFYTRLLVHLRHDPVPPTIGVLMKETLPFLPALVWLGFVVGFAIFVVVVCLAIFVAITGPVGAVIGIVFCIYLALRWAVAAPAMVVQHVSATDALRISGEVTQRALGSVLLFTVLSLIVAQAPQLLIDRRTMAFENILIAQAFLTALAAPVVAIGLGELFLRLAGAPARVVQSTPPAGPSPTTYGAYVPPHPSAAPQGPTYGAPVAPNAYQPGTPAHVAPVSHQPYAVRRPGVPPAQGMPPASQPAAQLPPAPGMPPVSHHGAQHPPPPHGAASAPRQPDPPRAPSRPESIGPPGHR